jgi:hypothetical protein
MTDVNIQTINREQARKAGHWKQARNVFDPHGLLPDKSDAEIYVAEPASYVVVADTTDAVRGAQTEVAYVPADVSTAALDAVTRSLAEAQAKADAAEHAREVLSKDVRDLGEINRELRKRVADREAANTELRDVNRVLRAQIAADGAIELEVEKHANQELRKINAQLVSDRDGFRVQVVTQAETINAVNKLNRDLRAKVTKARVAARTIRRQLDQLDSNTAAERTAQARINSARFSQRSTAEDLEDF